MRSLWARCTSCSQMCRRRSEADQRRGNRSRSADSARTESGVVAGFAGHLYAASQLVGPLRYTKLPAAILVADDAPSGAGPEPLTLKNLARAILALHCNQLPWFRLGIGLEDPMHGEDYRSNDTSSASGIPTAPSSTTTRSRGLHCKRSCPGARSTHRPSGARVYASPCMHLRQQCNAFGISAIIVRTNGVSALQGLTPERRPSCQ